MNLNERLFKKINTTLGMVLDVRRGLNILEVRYRFRRERFISVVHHQALQVVDAGMCADECLNLVNLSGVIQQAMKQDKLVITLLYSRTDIGLPSEWCLFLRFVIQGA